MNTMHKTFLTIFASCLLLTACGGGGGGSHHFMSSGAGGSNSSSGGSNGGFNQNDHGLLGHVGSLLPLEISANATIDSLATVSTGTTLGSNGLISNTAANVNVPTGTNTSLPINLDTHIAIP